MLTRRCSSRSITVYVLDRLNEVVQFLNGQEALAPAVPSEAEERPVLCDDFAAGAVPGKKGARDCGGGGHNLLMIGVPQPGKTMLARRLSSILPRLSREGGA